MEWRRTTRDGGAKVKCTGFHMMHSVGVSWIDYTLFAFPWVGHEVGVMHFQGPWSRSFGSLMSLVWSNSRC